jgi:hypothetical protein
MTALGMATRYMVQFWRQGIRSAHWLDGRTHGWLWMLAAAAQEALNFNSTIMAAAIAYFALFSLFTSHSFEHLHRQLQSRPIDGPAPHRPKARVYCAGPGPVVGPELRISGF